MLLFFSIPCVFYLIDYIYGNTCGIPVQLWLILFSYGFMVPHTLAEVGEYIINKCAQKNKLVSLKADSS